MAEFKIGDVVALKSGGPRMTVQKIKAGGGKEQPILCRWFDGNEVREAVFHSDTLLPGRSGRPKYTSTTIRQRPSRRLPPQA